MKKAPKKFITVKKEEGRSTSAFAKAMADKQKSPSISRNIPERQPFTWVGLASIRTHWEVIFVSFVCGVLLMGIGVVGLDLQKNLKELERRESLHQALSDRQNYWKEVVEKYPDYKDAYFQLAVISYQLGETDEANYALRKVLEIDPNDITVQEFEKKIRG